MAYDSYKIFLSDSASPKDKMLNDKMSQVKYLYNIAMDRENDCTINGVSFTESPRIFDRKTKANYAESITCETINDNDKFNAGNILFYDDNHWLCTSSFVFHELYCKGDFLITNWKLKWQNASGTIVERHCVESRISTVGIDQNKVIEIGKKQSKLLIPYDSETIKLRVGKRFYIDNNTENPTPYEITLANTTQYVKNGHGYLEFIVTETATIPEVDRPDLMLCNYISPTIPPDPEPTTKTYIASISYTQPEVSAGSKFGRNFTAVFKDADENVVTTLMPKWTITADFMDKITATEYTGYIKIVIMDTSLIDETFQLKLEATDDSAEPIEMTISIVSNY